VDSRTITLEPWFWLVLGSRGAALYPLFRACSHLWGMSRSVTLSSVIGSFSDSNLDNDVWRSLFWFVFGFLVFFHLIV
jgi:hypothetical protein